MRQKWRIYGLSNTDRVAFHRFLLENCRLTDKFAFLLFRGKDVESASILASSFFILGKNETKMCLVQLENVHVTFNVLKRILQERTFSRLNVNVSFVFSCLILPKKNKKGSYASEGENGDFMCQSYRCKQAMI